MKPSFKRFLLLFFCMFLTAGPLQVVADDTASLFHQGNESFSKGDYNGAIENYEAIINERGYSAPILYNLASSYAQAGNPGKAILNLERATRLAPSDSDISGNLDLVRKESGLFQTENSNLEKLFQLLSFNQWVTTLLVALVLLTLFVSTGLKIQYSRTVSIPVTLLIVTMFIIGISGVSYRSKDFNPAVVIDPDARLLVSPFPSSASIGTIQEGRLVYPEKGHNGFSYVLDETGRKGWITDSKIELVCK